MWGRIAWPTAWAAAGVVLASPALSVAGGLPSFADHTASAGLTFHHFTLEHPDNLRQPHCMTPGVAVGDFDRDGYLDLVVQGGLWQNAALFMNGRRDVRR